MNKAYHYNESREGDICMKHGSSKIINHITGIIIFTLIILSLSGLISKYMVNNYSSNSVQEAALSLVLLWASILSNIYVLRSVKDKYLIISTLNATIMIIFLLIIGACIEGNYKNVVARFGSIIAGTFISGYIFKISAYKNRWRKRRSS